jgi:ABC-type Fe3+-hydroxamate transport system substrate-binding protein
VQKYTDQIGNTILLRETPKRIVSLVPSQTELLFDLGLEKETLGITKFCIHPNQWFKSKTRVGGTKNVDFEKVKQLNPDLIIANKEENSESDIKRLMRLYPTWISDIKNIDHAYQMIISIGEITNKKEKAIQLVKKTDISINNLQKELKTTTIQSVLYLIWNNPFMSINSDTFIYEMLILNGWENIITTSDSRYPEISEEEVKFLQPDYIFLSSEPFPFKENHKNAIEQQFPNSKVVLVDGEMFSWYGSRLLKASQYFKSLHQILNLR